MSAAMKDTTIGEFAPFSYGKPLPQKNRVEGLVPVYSSAGKIDYHSHCAINGPGIIVGRKGTVGSVYMSKEPFWPIDTSFYIEESPHRDLRYTYYLLQSQNLSRLNEDSAVPGLNRGAAHAVEIRVHLLSEQREIGSLLGALDDKIELNRQINETLEAQARALFRDWFIDFGPVKAKMAGDTPYLAPDLWSLFPDRLGNDGVPEGWIWSTIGASFNLTMGQSPPGHTYNDDGNGLPFFQGRTDFGFRYPENRKYCNAPKRVAEAGDTLVSVRAPVGDINMAWDKSCMGRGVAALRHKSGSSSFTYYSAAALRPELEVYQHTGTVFGAINKNQFEELKTIEPDALVLKAFNDMAGPIDQNIRANELERRTLTDIRDLLLPKLMSGEIRISIEELIDEAV